MKTLNDNPYAIPVLRPLGSKKYCKGLSEYFKLTAPTYYDLEVLRQGEKNEFGDVDLNTGVWTLPSIRTSHFGIMEEYLNQIKMGSLNEKE